MHRYLLLTLLLMLPNPAYANLSADHLHVIRTQAFTLCSNLLVYYNPNLDGRDPQHAERYRHSLQALQGQLAAEKDSPLAQAVGEMRTQITGLEREPLNQVELHPNWIIPLLEAHARLDREAAGRYAAAPPEEQRQLTLHRLNLDVERLLLLYQTRTFGLLAVYVLPVDDDTVPRLDRQILQGFAALQHEWPEQAAELAKLARKYDFIRPRLLRHDQAWVPGSAAYYLGGISTRLVQLSAE